MSYQSQANLEDDQEFRGRVGACALEQALIFKDDGRPDIAALADAVIVTPGYGERTFTPLVAASPGIKDVSGQNQIDDGQILAAVQALWPAYAAIAYPPAPPPPEEEGP
jgi:hypothetical protein